MVEQAFTQTAEKKASSYFIKVCIGAGIQNLTLAGPFEAPRKSEPSNRVHELEVGMNERAD